MRKIDEQLMTEWVDALRSGEYPQGKRRLKTGGKPDKFCCLGVLADLISPEGWDGESWQYHKGALPSGIMQKLGEFVPPGKLLLMNDTEGKSFEEIADYIEGVVDAKS